MSSRSLEHYRQVCLIRVGAKLCRTPALQDRCCLSLCCMVSVNKGQSLTHSLVPGVQKLCERSRSSFCLNGLCCLLILSQLTQHSCRYPLDVLNRRIQQLQNKRNTLRNSHGLRDHDGSHLAPRLCEHRQSAS